MKITHCLPANINSVRVAVHGSLSGKVIAKANKRDDSRGIRWNAFTESSAGSIDAHGFKTNYKRRPIFGSCLPPPSPHKSLLSAGRPTTVTPTSVSHSILFCGITHVPLKNVLLTFFRGIPGLPAWKFDRTWSWARGEGQVHHPPSMIRTYDASFYRIFAYCDYNFFFFYSIFISSKEISKKKFLEKDNCIYTCFFLLICYKYRRVVLRRECSRIFPRNEFTSTVIKDNLSSMGTINKSNR